MKKLITALTLLIMFSTPSYAEWKRVGNTTNGDSFYVDFDRIRKVDGFVYWWQVTDFLKPDYRGDFSYKAYRKGE